MKFSHDDDPHLKTIPELHGRKSQYRGLDVILLCRDPRDVAVSQYLQMRSNQKKRENARAFSGSLDAFVQHGRFGIQNIITFMNIWAANRYIPLRFYILRYEDLRSDPMQALSDLLSFIGCESSGRNVVEKAVEWMHTVVLPDSISENKEYEGDREFQADGIQTWMTESGKVGLYEDHLGENEVDYANRMISENLYPVFGYHVGLSSKKKPGSSPNDEPVYLHIGYFKAASTWLQDLLSKTSGILLLHKPDIITDDTRYEKNPRSFMDLVEANRSKIGSVPFIVSDEHYSIGRIVQKEICHLAHRAFNLKTADAFIRYDVDALSARLKNAFPDAKVLMIIRSQTKWLTSVYKHNILNLGVDLYFNEYLKSERGSPYVRAGNYHEMYERYAALYGAENIKVMLFEELIGGVKDVIVELSDFLNVQIDPGLVNTFSRNEGMDTITAHLMMRMNRESETDPARKEKQAYLQTRQALQTLKKYWEKDKMFSCFEMVTDDDRHWLENHFKDGNRQLAEMIGKQDAMNTYGYL